MENSRRMNGRHDIGDITHICRTTGCLFFLCTRSELDSFLLHKVLVACNQRVILKHIFDWAIWCPCQFHLASSSQGSCLEAVLHLDFELRQLLAGHWAYVKGGWSVIWDHIGLNLYPMNKSAEHWAQSLVLTELPPCSMIPWILGLCLC